MNFNECIQFLSFIQAKAAMRANFFIHYINDTVIDYFEPHLSKKDPGGEDRFYSNLVFLNVNEGWVVWTNLSHVSTKAVKAFCTKNIDQTLINENLKAMCMHYFPQRDTIEFHNPIDPSAKFDKEWFVAACLYCLSILRTSRRVKREALQSKQNIECTHAIFKAMQSNNKLQDLPAWLIDEMGLLGDPIRRFQFMTMEEMAQQAKYEAHRRRQNVKSPEFDGFFISPVIMKHFSYCESDLYKREESDDEQHQSTRVPLHQELKVIKERVKREKRRAHYQQAKDRKLERERRKEKDEEPVKGEAVGYTDSDQDLPIFEINPVSPQPVNSVPISQTSVSPQSVGPRSANPQSAGSTPVEFQPAGQIPNNIQPTGPTSVGPQPAGPSVNPNPAIPSSTRSVTTPFLTVTSWFLELCTRDGPISQFKNTIFCSPDP